MNDIVFNRGAYYSYRYRRNKNGINNFSAGTHYEFMYLEEGEFIARYSKGSFTLKAGDILYFPVNWVWDFEFGNCKEIVGIVFHFRNWPGVDELDYLPQIIKADDKLKQLFEELPISENYSAGNKIDSSYIWRTYKFLDEIQPYIQKNNNRHVAAIQKVLEYMRTNDDYTIPQLVALSGMQKSNFYEVFEELLGSSPVQAKHRIQAYKAEILLAQTELSVDEISLKLGFNSVPHFRKVFKSRYHLSPREFRTKIKKPESDKIADVRFLSMQMGKSDTERRFVWYMSAEYTSAAVQYVSKTEYSKTKDFSGGKTVFGTVTAIFADRDNVSCKAVISDLTPGAEYFYRVGDGHSFDKNIYRFKVPSKADRQSFAVISDLHCNYAPDRPEFWQYRLPMWQNTTDAIKRFDPYPAFLLSAGDNISSYNLNLEHNQENMRKICEKEHEFLFAPQFMKSVPFASVMGNHEAQYYPEPNPYTSVTAYHYNLPNDDGFSGHFDDNSAGNFYFVSGDCLIIGINLTVDGKGNRVHTDFKTNHSYIKKAVENHPNVKWRILVTHIQGYTFIGGEEETDAMIRMQGDLCDEFEIDIMLTGHAHAFSCSHPIKNHTAIKNAYVCETKTDTLKNIGATVHYNIPAALNHSFTNIYEKGMDFLRTYGVSVNRNKDKELPCGFMDFDSPIFMHFEIENDSGESILTIKAVRSDNLEVIDTLKIIK